MAARAYNSLAARSVLRCITAFYDAEQPAMRRRNQSATEILRAEMYSVKPKLVYRRRRRIDPGVSFLLSAYIYAEYRLLNSSY